MISMIIRYLTLLILTLSFSVQSSQATSIGQSIDLECPCGGISGKQWKNHGEYVACIATEANSLIKRGIGSPKDIGEIKSKAAQSQCGRENENTLLRTISVHVFDDDGITSSGGGVPIFINDQEIGSTDDSGQFTTQLEAGNNYEIRAVEIGLAGATVNYFVDPETPTHTVTLITKGEGVTENTQLTILELKEGILSKDSDSITLVFTYQNGQRASNLVFFDYLHAFDEKNNDTKVSLKDIAELTSSGEIIINDVTVFFERLEQLSSRRKGIELYAEDEQGKVYSSTITFFIGQSDIFGFLSAPPSNQSLFLGDINIIATLLEDSDITLNATSTNDGSFYFKNLPIGNWDIRASKQDGEFVYEGVATMLVVNDIYVNITLRTVEDVLNGVPPFELVSSASSSASTLTADALSSRQSKFSELSTYSPHASLNVSATSQGSISVIAGAEGVAVQDTVSIFIPEGTSTISLEYIVQSDEYPTYVLSDSIFNDVWSLSVVAPNGGSIFSISRQVNSMVSVYPTWQSDGTTQRITETIDVSNVVNSEVLLVASATNIGDSALPTRVDASISFQPDFTIDKITADKVGETNDRYSIPIMGSKNTKQRYFNVEITKPAVMEITNAKLSLLGGSNEISIIVDKAPDGTSIVLSGPDSDKMKIIATYSGLSSSTTNSVPPPRHNIGYRLELTGMLEGVEYIATKEVLSKKALWRMPSGIERKGYRDLGGDDWSAKGAYLWIESNNALIPAIDDISGEHGKNIGHDTHQKGTDIDTYHFTHLLSGEKQGSGNYKKLRDYVVSALSGDTDAKNKVKQWMLDSRSGLSALANKSQVAQLIYHRGAAFSTLPSGWARTLLTTGKLTATDQSIIDLDIGSWTASTKIRFQNDHNDHLHIDLNDSLLNNAP
ncbi:hypothetical protein [Vibrio alfacsensis]|uniref:hypothetical protein n=1 Tax=Vibrio alfacsensis TaxID=1074311 RepID=UPI0040685433